MRQGDARVKREIERLKKEAGDSPVLEEEELKQRKNKWGLTPKQENFARNVSKGLSYTESYRLAYDTARMKATSIQTAASMLMDNERVARRVGMLLDERAKHSMASDAKAIRMHVIEKLLLESEKDDSPASARIAALVALGKLDIVGVFKEKTEGETSKKRKVEDIEAALNAKLEALLRNAKA